ncbi:GrpB family protein [Microbacterium sp. M28]|uniref:GrpB family protein n=1 Tax=Microbacterium sp. M28 TaxID=2962064 RepID=UPI0021F3CB17|nr:GrpB family protein [Microbacterium sp. M28]UYO97139.1 GrpB family protein [Microbacterium sp. M28]
MLVDYDPAWPEMFQDVAAELRGLGNAEWEIEHIGSTAVPGLTAKPIIDVAVHLTAADELDAFRVRLEAAGWRIGSGVRTHPVMVFEPGGVRTRIAHFFPPEQWDTANQRILRDWLLAHPDDAALYQEAKLAAARDAAAGRARYNAGKTAVIQQIVDRARQARGLASVPVYDK